MNFSTDQDLLALEPTVFNDVPFAAQQRVRASDGLLAGDTLMSASADFVAAEADAGSVVLIAGVPHHVLERIDAQTLRVQRTALADGDGLEVALRTFAPQAGLVHDALLRLLGIDADDPAATLTEDAIVSLSVMARLEALGTLEQVYSSAIALTGDNRPIAQKVRAYRLRFGRAVRSARVQLDLDGDGFADARRDLGLIRFTRA